MQQTKTSSIDQHNKQTIIAALQRRGGKSAIGNLGVYASDDATIRRAAKSAGVTIAGRVLSL
jgi:hypothetical protein